MKENFKPSKKRLIELAYFIKKARKEQNMGAKKLGEKLGVSPAFITKLESGATVAPDPLMLRQLSKALGKDNSHIQMYEILGYLEADELQS